MKAPYLVLMITAIVVAGAAAQDDQPAPTYYTHHRADGSRFVDGSGTFPDVQTLDIALDNAPAWVVGIPSAPGFSVTLANGTVQFLSLTDTGTLVNSGHLPEGTPPVLIADGSLPSAALLDLVSPFSHPVPVGDQWLHIDRDGNLILWRDGTEQARMALDIQPDARIVVNSAGQAAVYAGATNQRYVHGIMGDDLEGSALVVVNVQDAALGVITRIDLPGEEVFEGLSPFWADVDADGVEDLVTTVSSSQQGAQIRAYRVDGTLLANGPAVGRGGRWRHQLVFGPFGPHGEPELVDVLTPHIGGVVEFFRYGDGALHVAAALPGYTSHVIGSGNLDMAVGGDFNGDGQPEIVMPTQPRGRIAGLQRTPDGVIEVWSLPLDGRLVTNLAALSLPDGGLALAAGTEDNRLRVWLPRALRGG